VAGQNVSAVGGWLVGWDAQGVVMRGDGFPKG